jgi:mannan endo-1,4-beta-mannosidase
MWAKISAAIVMPVVVTAAVGALLVRTHHTKVPPLALPAMPTAPASSSPNTATNPTLAAFKKACHGQLPHPFAGIAVNNQIANHVAQFHQMTSARIKVVEFYNPFPGPFQGNEALEAAKVGAVPLIQLNPRKVTMSDVAAGKYDGKIRAYAKAVKVFGCQIILSFGHEMNGWWYPWGRCAPAICGSKPQTQPATFIAAWRHIHDIFTAEGVKNVIWSWDPSHQYSQYQAGKVASPASEWYPGKQYVDWVGLDGYLNPGQNFKGVFAHQLASIRSVAGSKPIYLAETGVAKNSPHAIRQIDDLFAGLSSYHLSGLIWFDQNAKQVWELQGRKAAIAEYRKFVMRFP